MPESRRSLSADAVRAIMLEAQGLCGESPIASKDDVLDAIRRMLALQIDTISVVARSPYFVLWSRIGDYDPRWLDELLAEGALFEGWSHAACFLPIEDYGLYRSRTLNGGRWRHKARAWLDANAELAMGMLSHIRASGPVRASDFERTDGQKSGWWNWKAEKLALECLFDAGELMIARRDNFQRVYDLRERVHRSWNDDALPSPAEVRQRFVAKAVRALGVCKREWLADYIRLYQAETRTALRELLDAGEVRTVTVEGWPAPGYYHCDNGDVIEAALGGSVPVARTTLLSPFDPIVWDRARALDLFGFDYRIECYAPAPKRIYGYFTLPVLYRNALIGRLDAKAHRREGIFEVKSLHLEPGVSVDDELVSELSQALLACAAWHKTPNLVVREANVQGLAAALSD